MRYIDYESEYPSIRYSTGAFFYKRREFAHERELRAVKQIHTYQGSEMVPHEAPGFPGKYQDGDLAGLIECVYVAPTSPGWFRELVFSVARKYGVNLFCRPSSLNVKPFV